MYSAIRNKTTEDVYYDVLEELQSVLGTGIYYIREFYLEDRVEEDVRVIEGIGRNDLDVESHLKPISDLPSVEVKEFEGNIAIGVDVVDSFGRGTQKIVDIYMELESEEDLDVEEYVFDFIYVAYKEFEKDVKGEILEVKEGEFITRGQASKIEGGQVFLADIDTYIQVLLYGPNRLKPCQYRLLDSRNQLKELQEIHLDIFGKVNRRGKCTLEKTNFSVMSKPQRIDEQTYLILTMFNHTLNFGDGDTVLGINKVLILKGNEGNVRHILTKFREKYMSILKEKGMKKIVGVFNKKDKLSYKQINVTNEGSIERYLGGNDLVIVQGDNFTNTKDTMDEYINGQVKRYVGKEHYRNTLERYVYLSKESKAFGKVYQSKTGTVNIPIKDGLTLVVGTHFAVIGLFGREGKYEEIYNLYREGKSIKEVKNGLVKYPRKIQNILSVLLNIADGRRRINIDEVNNLFRVVKN